MDPKTIRSLFESNDLWQTLHLAHQTEISLNVHQFTRSARKQEVPEFLTDTISALQNTLNDSKENAPAAAEQAKSLLNNRAHTQKMETISQHLFLKAPKRIESKPPPINDQIHTKGHLPYPRMGRLSADTSFCQLFPQINPN